MWWCRGGRVEWRRVVGGMQEDDVKSQCLVRDPRESCSLGRRSLTPRFSGPQRCSGSSTLGSNLNSPCNRLISPPNSDYTPGRRTCSSQRRVQTGRAYSFRNHPRKSTKCGRVARRRPRRALADNAKHPGKSPSRQTFFEGRLLRRIILELSPNARCPEAQCLPQDS